jgi:hypothetical protein
LNDKRQIFHAKDFGRVVVFLYESGNKELISMKNSILWAAGLLTVCVATALAQPQPARQPAPRPGTVATEQRPGELTRFSLDFPGGTPKALVEAIQKAMGKPLNAIVPDEYAEMKIPALKMANVNVQQLFSALEQASRKTQAYESGSYYGGGEYGRFSSIQQVTTSYGFQQGPGNLTDDTIWYFRAEKPPMPTLGGTAEAKAVRFYSLEPYLGAQARDRTNCCGKGCGAQTG